MSCTSSVIPQYRRLFRLLDSFTYLLDTCAMCRACRSQIQCITLIYDVLLGQRAQVPVQNLPLEVSKFQDPVGSVDLRSPFDCVSHFGSCCRRPILSEWLDLDAYHGPREQSSSRCTSYSLHRTQMPRRELAVLLVCVGPRYDGAVLSSPRRCVSTSPRPLVPPFCPSYIPSSQLPRRQNRKHPTISLG